MNIGHGVKELRCDPLPYWKSCLWYPCKQEREERTGVQGGKRASHVRKNTNQTGVPSKVIRSRFFVPSVSLLQAPATWRAEEAAVGTTCAQAMFFVPLMFWDSSLSLRLHYPLSVQHIELKYHLAFCWTSLCHVPVW